MEIDDRNSTAYQYLSYLNDVCPDGGYGAPVRELGRDLGLADNETRDVVQCLLSIGMLKLRGSARGSSFYAAILTNYAAVSERGRRHLRLMETDRATGGGDDVN